MHLNDNKIINNINNNVHNNENHNNENHNEENHNDNKMLNRTLIVGPSFCGKTHLLLNKLQLI